MCTQDGDTSKGCCIPPDTYRGIFSVPDHPGYIIIWKITPWAHPLWCDDLHLYGANVRFTTEGRLFCLPKPYVLGKISHHLRRLIHQNLQ